MVAKFKDGSENAPRLQRSSVKIALLSTSILMSPGWQLLRGDDSVESRNLWQATEKKDTPVLKSVGIRFVADRSTSTEPTAPAASSDKLPVKATSHRPIAPTTATQQVPRQSSKVLMTEVRQVLPVNPVLDAVVESEPAKQAATVKPPTVVVNSFIATPTIKMPPLVASSSADNTARMAKTAGHDKAKAVRIEMASVAKSLGISEPKNPHHDSAILERTVSAAPVLVASASPLKIVPTKSATDDSPIDASPADTSLADTSSADDERSVSEKFVSVEKSNSVSLSPPRLPETRIFEEPKVSPEKDESLSLAVNPNLPDRSSRAASIVRIPSMTLGSKHDETIVPMPVKEVPAEVPSREVPVEEVAMADLRSSAPVIAESAPVIAESAPVIAESAPVIADLPVIETEESVKTFAASPSSLKADQVAEASPTVVAIPASSPWLNRSLPYAEHPSTASDPSSDQPAEVVREPANENVEVVYRDVENIKLNGVVERIEVEDESICKAMVPEANGLLLLGVGRGKTRVNVWLSSNDASQPQPHVIDVSVREPWVSVSPQPLTSFADATQSIAELFPTARIALRSNENGSLTVFGRTDSDEQAKHVVSLVRKMFLVPVQDRIAVVSPK